MAQRRAGGTPATVALTAAGVAFEVHEYHHDPRSASFGLEAAAELGLDPDRVCKTLLASADGRLVVGIVPVSGRLDLKALAAAVGGKRATMMAPAAAERLTGYVVGGIAPLGSQRPVPVLVDLSTAAFDTVFCSAGRRGLQMELAPDDLLAAAGATLAELAV